MYFYKYRVFFRHPLKMSMRSHPLSNPQPELPNFPPEFEIKVHKIRSNLKNIYMNNVDL